METILFNANFNYLFNFIEKAPVHNFADANSMSKKIKLLLSGFQ